MTRRLVQAMSLAVLAGCASIGTQHPTVAPAANPSAPAGGSSGSGAPGSAASASPDAKSAANTSDETPAAEEPEETGLLSLLPDIHAFVSQGYIKSTGNNYLVASKHGSFEFNEAAVNFTKSLTDRLRMGVQFFAQDLGSQPGNYTVTVDWLYADYRFKDWLGIRAGRTKLPFGLYNEVNEIDAARVPILLPQSVYPILNRTILLAQTGAELYGYIRLGAIGALDYRLYGGTVYVNPPTLAAPFTLTNFAVPYLYGGRLLWETPLEGLRLGGSIQALRLDESASYPTSSTSTGTISLHLPFVLALASAEYSAHDLLLAVEYGRWSADVEGNAAPNTRQINERFYGMGSYRVASWFVPGLYYSVLVPNIDHRSATQDYQDDLAATLRFDINAHWLFKLEAHYIQGTADLDPSLNGGAPLSTLAGDWWAFFANTTVYF